MFTPKSWEKVFFDSSSPSTPTVGGRKHWLLVMENSMDYVWSSFLKEKLELNKMIMGLIKNLKLCIIFRSCTCTVTTWEKMSTLKGPINWKGWEWSSSILPQVLPNRMAVLIGSLLPTQSGTCNAQQWEIFCLSEKWLMVWSHKHHHPSWK